MLIPDLVTYIKHIRVINKMVKAENLLSNLSTMFGTTFKRDWIGRIYTVINPVVQLKPEELIYEYDANGMNIKSTVYKFVMDRMVAANNFIVNHELFDILTYDIEQLDDDYNFLFVLTPIAWPDLRSSLKRFVWEAAGLLAAGAAGLAAYFWMFN